MLKSVTALFSAAVLSVGVAVAATPQSQGIDDNALQKFVVSAQQVAMISQEYSAKLQNAEGETAQQQIIAEANDKMVEAVQAQGLSVAEFNGISDAMQQDPTLAERAQQLVP